MVLTSKPIINCSALNNFAPQLNSLQIVKALKTLAIIFLLQPGSCEYLRGERKETNCGTYENESLADILQPQVIQHFNVPNLIPCIEEKLISIKDSFINQHSALGAVNYLLKSNHSSTDPYNGKIQKSVPLMGLILRIPQHFPTNTLKEFEHKFKFMSDWIKVVDTACNMVGAYGTNHYESRLIITENGEKQLQTLSELLMLSLEQIPYGIFDTRCPKKCTDFVVTMGKVLKGRLKYENYWNYPTYTYVTRSDLRKKLGADSIEYINGQIYDSEIEMLARDYENYFIETLIFEYYEKLMHLNKKLIQHMTNVIHEKHERLVQNFEDIKKKLSTVKNKENKPKLRQSKLGVEKTNAKKDLEELIDRAKNYKKTAETCTQADKQQNNMTNEITQTPRNTASAIEKLKSLIKKAEIFHDEL